MRAMLWTYLNKWRQHGEKDHITIYRQGQAGFATDDPDVLWMTYTNQATALNGEKKAQIAHKGELNRAISTLLFKELTAAGIPTHYIDSPDATTMIVKKATMLPLEVVVRNYASGHFVTKFNVKPMMKLDPPIHEYYYKSDELGDPFMNEAQIFALHEATRNSSNKFGL